MLGLAPGVGAGVVVRSAPILGRSTDLGASGSAGMCWVVAAATAPQAGRALSFKTDTASYFVGPGRRFVALDGRAICGGAFAGRALVGWALDGRALEGQPFFFGGVTVPVRTGFPS